MKPTRGALFTTPHSAVRRALLNYPQDGKKAHMSEHPETSDRPDPPGAVKMLHWAFDYIAHERSLIRKAPLHAAFALILSFVISGVACRWWFAEIISTQATTIESKTKLIEDYESQLGVKSPREAYEKLEALREALDLKTKETSEVYPDFVPIIKENPSLGKPLDAAKNTDYAKETIYQKAWVIWINSLSKFYILPLKGGIRTTYNNSKWDSWCNNETQLRKNFNPPHGFLRPNGGIACMWKENNLEKIIGWRNGDDCLISNNRIKYQIFDNGIIVGPLHKNMYINDGEYVVIPDNKPWFPVSSPTPAARCDKS